MLQLKKCPACRARLGRVIDVELPCRRCGSDLRLLARVYEQARHWQSRARRAMAREDFVAGLAAARRAQQLIDERETRETLAAALLALERVSEAMAVLEDTG